MENSLYYGDNLDILRRYIKDESVDLIYLDPPFNSKATYNMLFKEHSGEQSEAQFQAFEDTWHWDASAALAYQEVAERGEKISQAVISMRSMLGDNDMMAYISMMSIRLIELRRVLKSSGSIYLHCDPTASHYLKILMDMVFGPVNFRNEITWKRRYGFSSAVHESNRFGNCTDTILFYSKSEEAEFYPQYNKDSKEYQDYIKSSFTMQDEDGRLFQATSLTNPAYRPNLIYEYKGYKPPANGWMITKEKMEQWDKEGRIYFPSNKNGRLRRKSYVDELRGMPIQNLWDDIEFLGSHDNERLGFPTQKPLALLERIIQASSDPGDIVLDPFCGCGTAIIAAQKLNRQWIGIDITHLAITVMKRRLIDIFEPDPNFKIIGEPTSLEDAKELARTDPYQFQWWILGFVGARPADGKKGADKGIDGRLFFHEQDGGETKQVIFSVKAGGTNASHIRDLHGVIDREKAAIGVLITMEAPTKPMKSEAASGGIYSSPWGNHPKLQILTVEDLLEGKKIDMPPVHQVNVTYKRANKGTTSNGKQPDLFQK